jgi:EAL and modified HD-GYP domain-containing signal transduction protein
MRKSEVYVGRQPVLDQNMGLFAYELRFHLGMNPNGHTIPSTEALIDKIENDLGFHALLGSYPCMLHLPTPLLKPESIPQFGSDHLVLLEIGTEVLKDAATLRSLKELKLKGYHFLLDDYIDDAESEKLATITSYVKIKVSHFNELQLHLMVEKLHKKGIKVIADAIQNEEEFDYLKQFDFDYYQGYFFTNPTVINGNKLSGNKLNLLQLMAKVNAPNTQFDELSEIISQDVGLSHKLLMAINHPANDMPVRVEKIADGLRYMGLKRLKFWVNLLMLSNMEDVPQALLTTSLLNAKFCELMAEQGGHGKEKDSYFLAGLLSNLDAYFKTPIIEVAAALPLSDELNRALVKHEGPIGEVLNILKTLQNKADEAEEVSFEGVGIVQISKNFLAAGAWAQEAVMA